jgi:hypothetical protein
MAKTFRAIEKDIEIGAWRLETDKERAIIPATAELTAAVLGMVARVPFEANRVTASLYDLHAGFEDKSSALFSLKPYSNDHYRQRETVPKRRDQIDIRLFSLPFIGSNGSLNQLVSIVECTDFRMEQQNVFLGGRKVLRALGRNYEEDMRSVAFPTWQDIDWDGVETMCPITPGGIQSWLGRLATQLDINKVRNANAIAVIDEPQDIAYVL